MRGELPVRIGQLETRPHGLGRQRQTVEVAFEDLHDLAVIVERNFRGALMEQRTVGVARFLLRLLIAVAVVLQVLIQLVNGLVDAARLDVDRGQLITSARAM